MRPIKLTRYDLPGTDYTHDARSLDLDDERGKIEAAFMQGWDDAG